MGGGASVYTLDGGHVKFDWYGNCDGDVDIIANLMRWLMSVTNESDAYTGTQSSLSPHPNVNDMSLHKQGHSL